MEIKHENYSVSTSLTKILRGEMNTNPNYQRNFVWKSPMKSQLIVSILIGFPIGNITLHKRTDDTADDFEYIFDVVDGQQRLKTLNEFIDINDNIKKISLGFEESKYIISLYKDDFIKEINRTNNKRSKRILNIINKYNDNINVKLNYSDFTTKMKNLIVDYQIPVTIITDANDKEVRLYFKRIQQHERLTVGEIIKTSNNILSVISESLNEMVDGMDKNIIESVFGFNNKRDEIYKIITNIYGIITNKLNLGCTDKKIENFSNSINDENIDKNSVDRIKRIEDFVNLMTEKGVKLKLNKQTMKLLFLLIVSDIDNYNIIISYGDDEFKYMNELFNNLSIFKSKSDDKEEKIKEKFKNYNSEFIKLHEDLSVLTSGNHQWTPRLKRTISNIIEIVNIEKEQKVINNKKEIRKVIENQQKITILKEQDYKCYVCKNDITLDNAEFDHIIPFSKGGTSNVDNIGATCFDCNREKSNKLFI